MDYDIFFSISQTPTELGLPSENQLFENFFQQVEVADELGFGTAWIAEAHLSSEVQKRNRRPVIPHWEGEVGLNVDFLQLANRIFQCTERIEAGSAVMNILCNGGPVAHAERIAAFLQLHGLDESETRRIHVGFAAGRFDFNNTPTGPHPSNAFEEEFWRPIKGRIFERAAFIFLRLLRGDVLQSDEVPLPELRREHLRSDEEWAKAREMSGTEEERIRLPSWWNFEEIQIVPRHFRRDLLQLVLGSHDPQLQERVNSILPVQVFNLSITRPEVIEETHRRMRESYHPDGGPWQRPYMPRTVFVFVNDEPGYSPEEQSARAHEEARAALGAYWKALEGTIDPDRVEKAADNALIGNVREVAEQVIERFNPDDRLMLWFDFFNHDSERVVRNMRAFMHEVRPRVEEALP